MRLKLRYLGQINYKKVSPDGKTRIGDTREVSEVEASRLMNGDPNAWEIVNTESKPMEAKMITPDENKEKKVDVTTPIKDAGKNISITLDDSINLGDKMTESPEDTTTDPPKRGRPKKSRLNF